MENRVVFKEEVCKSCGLCISACPKNIIVLSSHINGKGYRPAMVEDQEACISCAACGRVCPDNVITVYKPVRQKATV